MSSRQRNNGSLVAKGEREKVPAIGRNCSFPNKVYQVLEYAHSKGLEDIISWSPDGKSFSIYVLEDFIHQISPQFFPNHSSFRSFERLLCMWGFRRLSSPRRQKAYYHQHLQRGKPHLCRKITRTENKGLKRKFPSVGGYTRVNTAIPANLHIHQEAALRFLGTMEGRRTSTSNSSQASVSQAPQPSQSTPQGFSAHDQVQDFLHQQLTALSCHHQQLLNSQLSVLAQLQHQPYQRYQRPCLQESTPEENESILQQAQTLLQLQTQNTTPCCGTHHDIPQEQNEVHAGQKKYKESVLRRPLQTVQGQSPISDPLVDDFTRLSGLGISPFRKRRDELGNLLQKGRTKIAFKTIPGQFADSSE